MDASPVSFCVRAFNCAALVDTSVFRAAMLLDKDMRVVDGKEASSSVEKEGTLIPASDIGGSEKSAIFNIYPPLIVRLHSINPLR